MENHQNPITQDHEDLVDHFRLTYKELLTRKITKGMQTDPQEPRDPHILMLKEQNYEQKP